MCNNDFESFSLTVREEDVGSRLDLFLSRCVDGYSRSDIKKAIADNAVFVNSRSVKASYALKAGDSVEAALKIKRPFIPQPEDIALDIRYEDEYILVVNKPKGMVVHPAAGNYEHTLVNALLYHCGDRLSRLNGDFRAGIVHRIDKDTSGLLCVAKTEAAHEAMTELLRVHDIKREYWLVAIGGFDEDEFTVDRPIGRNPNNRLKMAIVKDGKNAVTHFKVLERFEGYTYLSATLETGRTHQIRVHLASMGRPILGDAVYGPSKNKFKIEGQALHAAVLGFKHPVTGEWLELEAEEPEYLKELLNKLRGGHKGER